MNDFIKIKININNKKNIINVDNCTEYKLVNNSSKTLLHFDIYNQKNELIADIFEKFSIITPIFLLRDKDKNVIASFQKDYDISGFFINIDCDTGNCYIKNTFDKNIDEVYKNDMLEAILTKTLEHNETDYILTLNNDHNIIFFIGLLVIYIRSFSSSNKSSLIDDLF